MVVDAQPRESPFPFPSIRQKDERTKGSRLVGYALGKLPGRRLKAQTMIPFANVKQISVWFEDERLKTNIV